MAKKRGKMKVISRKPMTAEKYIVQKGRVLDFYECLINEEWEELGLATIVICKQMPGGNFVIGLYLIDFLCLGLKNSYYRFNFSKADYDEFVKMAYSENDAVVKCDTTFAHNLIYGAIDYAADLGFLPNIRFSVTENLLDHDLISDEIDEIEFGKDGTPIFIQGPKDNVAQIINKLNEAVGKGNFDFIRSAEN